MCVWFQLCIRTMVTEETLFVIIECCEHNTRILVSAATLVLQIVRIILLHIQCNTIPCVIGSEKREHFMVNANIQANVTQRHQNPQALFLVYRHPNPSTKEIQRQKVQLCSYLKWWSSKVWHKTADFQSCVTLAIAMPKPEVFRARNLQ